MKLRVLLPISVWASLYLSFVAVAVQADERPLVVASINPLALVAREIMGDRGQVSVLLKAGQTPHNYAFRMSDRRRVDEADVLLWAGPHIEPYLEKIAQAKTGLALQPKSDISYDEDHHAHPEDTHLWLSISKVVSIAHSLTEILSELDPEGEHQYRQNTARLESNLDQLLVSYKSRMERQPRRPEQTYAVAHRAYDHFLATFPFPQPVVLADSPEVSPGARSLWESGKQLSSGSCVLIESDSRPKWLNSFVERHQLITLQADILGYSKGVSNYTDMISRLLNRFEECSGEG